MIRRVVLAVSAASLSLPAAAVAEPVAISVGDGVLIVQGTDAAEAVDVTVEPGSGGRDAANFRVAPRSGTTVSAGPGCERPGREGTAVTCPTTGVVRLRADLRGGDDQISARGVDVPTELIGGEGADGLTGGGGDDRLDGGPGPDTLGGGAGSDVIDHSAATAPVTIDLAGGPGGVAGDLDTLAGDIERVIGGSGPDTLRGNDAANVLDGRGGDDDLDGRGGFDALLGGDGADRLAGGPGGPGDADELDGGSGTDVASYATRTTTVAVSLDDVANDGAAGEADNVRAEALVGGGANDGLGGSPRNDVIQGGGGDDIVDGAGGNDAVSGGLGNDYARGGPGNDAVHGGSGDDQVIGGDGNDRLYGDPGADTIRADAGDDLVVSAEGTADDDGCGAGDDRTLSDEADKVDADCEQLSGVTSGSARSATAAPTGTGLSLPDGDGPFGPTGDLPADASSWDLAPEELVALGLEDFGTSFDSDWFGVGDLFGFDDADFGTLDGSGGSSSFSDGTEPKVATTRATLDAKGRVTITIRCPKTAERRCIGELTLTRIGTATAKKSTSRLGRATFAANKGKSAKVRVPIASRGAQVRRATQFGLKALAVVEARDGGDRLWRVSEALRLLRPKRR